MESIIQKNPKVDQFDFIFIPINHLKNYLKTFLVTLLFSMLINIKH